MKLIEWNKLPIGNVFLMLLEEPLAENSPLRNMDNVYLLPHMGGPTGDRRPYITKHLADDVARFFAGESLKYEITEKFAQRMTKMH